MRAKLREKEENRKKMQERRIPNKEEENNYMKEVASYLHQKYKQILLFQAGLILNQILSSD